MVVRRAESASLPHTALDPGSESRAAEPGGPVPEPAARVEASQPDLPAQVQPVGGGLFDATLRFARGLGVAFAMLFFWSAAFVFAWFVVPYIAVRERDPIARRRRLQRLVAATWRWFHRQLARATLFRCAYEGDALGDAPAVLVANHPTLLDVTAIMARAPHACCVVKHSLIHSPLVGRLLRACGHVPSGDGSLMGGIGVYEGISQRLQEGFPVLIFPEGTRSPPAGMRRFRRGAFEIAKRAAVPVVPLFLRCDPPALGKGAPVWRHPRRCPTLTVHVGAALGVEAGDPIEICQNVQRDFRARLGLSK